MTQTETKTAATQLQLDDRQVGTNPHTKEVGTTVNSTQPIVQLDACPPWCNDDHFIDGDGIYHCAEYTQFAEMDITGHKATIAASYNAWAEEPWEIDISVNDDTKLVLHRDQALRLAKLLLTFTEGPEAVSA